MIKRREVGAFLVCVLVLTFIFGFNDGSAVFSYLNWINNLIKVFFLSFLCLLIYVMAQKFAAHRFDAFTEFKIWMVRRFKVAHKILKPKQYSPIPIGILTSILVSLISYGQFIFTGLWENTLGYDERKRVGRDLIRLTEFERGKILFAGPAALIIFVIVLEWFAKFGYNIEFISTMAFLIAFTNMLPIPGLDGSKIFFGSKHLWVFSFLFVILGYGLGYLGIIASLFWSVVLAFFLLGIYYYRVNSQ